MRSPMSTWTKATPNLMDTRWFVILISFLVISLSGLAGGLVSGLTWFLAGKEYLVLIALLGSWLMLFLSVTRFDFMVLAGFCLFSVVRIEPAPTDMLVALLLPVGLLMGKLSLRTLTGSSFIHVALWGFLLANLVSLVPVNAIFDGLRYVLITVYMIASVYFVKMYVTSLQATRNVMIGYLVSAGLALCLVALGYLGIGTELFIKYGTRAQGPFKDTNVFGPFFVLMIVFLVDEILHPHLFQELYLAKVLGIVAMTAGVFLSGSRAAWGNLALSLLLYFALAIRHLPRTRIVHLLGWLRSRAAYLFVTLIMGALIFVALFQLIGFQNFVEIFLVQRARFQLYDTTRFARQIEGINAGLVHLVGVGPGMWGDAHSLYVRTFAEHGIFGLVALLLLVLVLSVSTLCRALRETDKTYGISAKVIFACLVGHLMNSIVIDTIHWRHFWFVLALAWVVNTAEHKTVVSDWQG
jgi:hypothetical protein